MEIIMFKIESLFSNNFELNIANESEKEPRIHQHNNQSTTTEETNESVSNEYTNVNQTNANNGDVLSNEQCNDTQINTNTEFVLRDYECLIINVIPIVSENLYDDFDYELNNMIRDAEINKEELSAAFLAAFYNGQTTQSSLSDFLKLANIFSPIKIPTSFDGLKHIIQTKTKSPDLTYVKSWFCGTCLKKLTKLDSRLQRNCDICRSRLNMYYNLNIEHQVQTIMNKFKSTDLIHVNDSNDLKDIRDGILYKKILQLEDGHLFKQGRAFTFLINTDGISFCKKSKLAIWPVYIVINELPIHSRFSIDNVILAGKFTY